MVMPFGRHAGADLAEVPSGYLLWALREVALSRYPGLRPAIEITLADRRARYSQQSARPDAIRHYTGPGGVDDRVRRGVRHCYREMALLYHPDRRGGDTTAMAAVNHAFDRLRAVLELE